MALPTSASADPTATPSGGSSTPTSPTPTAAPTPSSSTSYSLKPTEFSITVSPARLVVGSDDLDGTHQLSVVNRGQESVQLEVQKRNFTAEPDGSMRFDENAPYAAADWVDVAPTSFELKPGATQQVTAEIARPAEVEPGDHSVALVVMVPTREAGGNVRINRGVAAPLYIAVGGTADNSVRLQSVTGTPFTVTGSIHVTATLENTGNTHRDFRGPNALQVTGGGKTSTFPDFTVVRGATRVTSTEWKAPLVCICHPTVSFTNADGAQQSIGLRVIVFPWWLGIVLLVALCAAIVIPIARRRRQRAGAAPARAATGPPSPPAGDEDG